MGLWKIKNGERRRGDRRKAGFQARFRVLDAVTRGGLGPQQPGLITDISEAGCCLELGAAPAERPVLERCLELPRDYLVELCLQPASGGTWRLAAAVRWISPAGRRLRVGLRFEEPVALPSFWLRLLTAPGAPLPAANLAAPTGPA
jgi:hypothetical protein